MTLFQSVVSLHKSRLRGMQSAINQRNYIFVKSIVVEISFFLLAVIQINTAI